MSELKYLANGLPVVVIEDGDGAPYDEGGIPNPSFKPARVATFATVEEVEAAQLHDTPPAPVETGTSPDPAALQAQLVALSEQLQRLTAAGVGGPDVAPPTPPPSVPVEQPAALADLSTEQLQAALAERQAATQQG